MSFAPSFPLNAVVENTDIISEFKCGNMGGMRRSRKTNTLVIISDHTKGLYDDKWFGDVLHYTGMGKSADQDINFMQNRTLAESNTNGVDVHLFEVLKEGQYIYKGPVELCAAPYQEMQRGEDGVLRKVWMFPVHLKNDGVPIDESIIIEHEKRKQRQARRLTTAELKQRAEDSQSKDVSVRIVKSTTFIRDPYVSEYVKRAANGNCQLCEEKAPFKDKNGNPYLETHHIDWLSKDGADTIDNTVALCPNCHRKMHILNYEQNIRKLKNVAKNHRLNLL